MAVLIKPIKQMAPDRIARVFANWIETLKQVIDTNGDYP
jgi:hypothetical protein